MSRSPDLPGTASGPEPEPAAPEQPAAAPVPRPNLSGDLDDMLGRLSGAPVFRRRPNGYDRLQVDNYVVWAETELQATRRQADDLLERYGRCWAELELARRVLAHSPGGQQMARVSERIGAILELAADEAAELTAAAAAEAERLRSEARADADGMLRRAHEVKQVAVADADRLLRSAADERAAAAAERKRTMADVAELEKRAAEERAGRDDQAARLRERLEREAAERIRRQDEAAREEREAAEAAARERLARIEAEIAELERRRELARDCLQRMCDQVNEAVALLADGLPAPGLRLAPPHRAAS